MKNVILLLLVSSVISLELVAQNEPQIVFNLESQITADAETLSFPIGTTYYLKQTDSSIKPVYSATSMNYNGDFELTIYSKGNSNELVKKSLKDYSIKVLFYQLNDNTNSQRSEYSSSSFLSQEILDNEIEVQMFPNPSVDRLTVRWTENSMVNTVDLMNIRGELIRSIQIRDESQAIFDVTDLEKGIYLVAVISKTEILDVQRIVVKS